MKVLVTWATGFLGSHLCHRLVREGHQVMAFRRTASDIAPLDGLDVSYALGDITDPESVNRAVKGQENQVHAAAHLMYWRHVSNVQTRVNVDGTKNIIWACKQYGVGRLLHVSSVAAIGMPPGHGCLADETFAFNLSNSGLNYHLSKRRAEEAILEEVPNGLDAVITNPSSMFGPFGNHFRGSEVIDKVRRSRIVPHFIGGTNVVHVDDVVDGIIRSLRCGRTGERYILGGENLRWRRLGELVAGELGVRRLFVPVPPPVTWLAAMISEPIGKLSGRRPRFTRDVHYCAHRCHFYDSSKARKELGYNPRPFGEILREFLSGEQEHKQQVPSG